MKVHYVRKDGTHVEKIYDIDDKGKTHLKSTIEYQDGTVKEKGGMAMEIKFKPVYKYQSAEFTMTVDDIDKAMDIYESVLRELKRVADSVCPEIETVKTTKPVVEFKPVSDSQKSLMDKLGLHYDNSTSMSEAREMIAKAMNK